VGVKVQGTQLFLRFNDSSGYSMVQVGCPTGVTGLGGAANQIDDTCLDDEEMKYQRGMPNPGTMQVALNFDPSKISHQQLWDLFDSGDNVQWVLGWSDGKNIAPTVNNSTGVITFPDTRTFTEFNGYIADLPLDFAINTLVKSNMAVQRSGPRTMHYKA
jgi:hypothetical protein